MMPNLLENVPVYLLSHAVTRYCMLYILAICRKLEFVFRINHVVKKSDVENLKKIVLIHGLF